MHKPLPFETLTAANIPVGQHVLHRDYETRSRAILKVVGAQRYAADPSSEVLCCAYAVDDDPVKLWRPGDPVPSEFVLAAQNSNWLAAAFNDSFEAAIEKSIMAPRYRWLTIPIERHRCTQAMCLALGLPARLSTAADALELSHRKDAAGERLMHQTSKPRHARKNEDPNGIYWFDDEERLDRLYSYCAQDIEVERELRSIFISPAACRRGRLQPGDDLCSSRESVDRGRTSARSKAESWRGLPVKTGNSIAIAGLMPRMILVMNLIASPLARYSTN